MMLYEKWPCATIFEDGVGLATNFSERVAAVTATWLLMELEEVDCDDLGCFEQLKW